MADDRIEIEISLDDGSVRQGFARVLSDGKSTASGLTGAFGGVAKSLAAIATAAIAFKTLKSFIGDAINEAMSADAAVNRLNNSLKLAGGFSEQASKDFQALANTLQATTVYSDDQVMSVQALALNYAKTNEQAIALTKASIDLAAATGRDVESAVRSLGGSLSGVAGQLTKLVPATKEFTEEQLKAGAALDAVASRFKGAAAAEANTFGGRIIQMKNAFSDFLEEIGRFVTQSPAVMAVFTTITKAIVKMTEGIGSARIGDPLKSTIRSALTFATILANIVVPGLEQVYNVGKIVFYNLKTVIDGVIAFMASAIGSFVKMVAPNSELAKNLAIFKESSAEIFMETAEKASSAFSNGLDFSITNAVNKLLADMSVAVDTAAPITSALANQFTKVGEAASDAAKSIHKSFQDGILRTISTAVSFIGASLGKGSFGFKQFAGAVLSVIGDMAIQIGTTLVGIGIGIDAIKLSLATLTGGWAIAAGLALIAVGGLLKSLSGGGVAVPTSGPVTGGGGGYAPVDPGGDMSDERKEKAMVTVNIQGDVLDTRETGMRIVEIINEAQFASGARILAT